MLRPALTVAVVVLAATAGCGGDDEASSPADAVRAYNEAVADGDAERACSRLTKDAQDELRQSTQGAARGSCKEVIELLAAFYDDATKQRLRDAEVVASSQGDNGTARFTSPVDAGPGRAQTYALRRDDDGWKIDSLGIEPADPGLVAP